MALAGSLRQGFGQRIEQHIVFFPSTSPFQTFHTPLDGTG